MIFGDIFPLQFAGERQWEIFSLACLLGIALGAVYEVIRAARRGLHIGSLPEQIADFLYVTVFFFCYFVFSVAQTGDFRFFVFGAMLIGAAAERYTLARLLLPALTAVFSGIRVLLSNTVGRACEKIIQKSKLLFVENKSKFKKLKKTSKSS